MVQLNAELWCIILDKVYFEQIYFNPLGIDRYHQLIFTCRLFSDILKSRKYRDTILYRLRLRIEEDLSNGYDNFLETAIYRIFVHPDFNSYERFQKLFYYCDSNEMDYIWDFDKFPGIMWEELHKLSFKPIDIGIGENFLVLDTVHSIFTVIFSGKEECGIEYEKKMIENVYRYTGTTIIVDSSEQYDEIYVFEEMRILVLKTNNDKIITHFFK